MRLILGNIILLAALIWTFVDDEGVMPPESLFFDEELAPVAEAATNVPAEIAQPSHVSAAIEHDASAEVWTREIDPAGETALENTDFAELSPTTDDDASLPIDETETIIDDTAVAGEPVTDDPSLSPVDAVEVDASELDAGELDAIAASLEQFYLSRQR